MAVEIRGYQAGDERGIVDLLSETFAGWPNLDLECDPVDYWRWLFIDNPAKISAVALAISDGRIIGCNHDLVQRIKIGESLYLSGQGVALAIHSNFRGMGLYNKISSRRDELEGALGIEFHYSISENPILVNRNKRVNLAFPSQMVGMVRIRDIDAYLKTLDTSNAYLKKYGYPGAKFLSKYGYHGVKMLNKLRTSSKTYGGFDDDFEISDISRFGDDYSVFWEGVKPHYSFIVCRDLDYLNWRYLDPRGGKYKVKVAKAGDQLLGYIVLRVNRFEEGKPIGVIVDLLASPHNLDVALRLVEEGVRYFDAEGVNLVRVSILKNSVFEPLLQKTGFAAPGGDPFLTIKKESSQRAVDALARCDKKSMHFFLGDSDHI